ncbi:MMPL family transporter [Luteipulveratus halotolerans]|uniref:MMPL family transporter n=1 Tax=Luteipulveratus halotolerans TaxID=1631356 RepID=UPI001E38DB92|nr:MMPL family transporter [Luteipulveratus halotolerans]
MPKFSDSLTGSSLNVSGSQSARAEQLLQEEFSGGITEDAAVVIDSMSRPVTDSQVKRVVAAASSLLREHPGVVRVQDPYTAPDGTQISRDGRTALVLVGLSGEERSRQNMVPKLQAVLDNVATDEVTVHLTGSSALNAAVVEQEDKDLARAESIGLPVALLVLLLAFGTLVAAGLPLLLGVAALVTAFGALGALSYLTSFDVFVQAVVTMLGLALGIDYCLFVVTRFREELRSSRGADMREVVGATMATAGKAVLFSGTTVLISVAGLLLVRAPVFRSMALGVMVAVAVMLVLALTLLPAVLAMCGTRINRLAVPGMKKAAGPTPGQESRWERWTHVVMRHPLAIGATALAALLLAASPALGLRLGFDVGADAVADAPAGAGYATVAQKFAPGAATPIQAVLQADRPINSESLAALDRLAARVKAHPQVAGVESVTELLRARYGAIDSPSLQRLQQDAGPTLNRLLAVDGASTTLTIYSKYGPDNERSIELVRWLRSQAAPPGTSIHVGGLTAQTIDVADEIDRATPWVLAAILGASFVLLLLAFRSLVLAATAIAMNLLSVGAAFGLLTWVFQQGAGESLLDFSSKGFIQAYLPLLTFVVLFGLSMDYEVFLISRMKEEWDRHRNNERAITAGVTHTAKVITAAAAIMVVVFAAFMITRVVEVKQMGFALAVAVLIDATLIRVVLVPALMKVLGSANWWLPRGIDRYLPKVDLAEMGPVPDGARTEAGRVRPASADIEPPR